MIKFRAWYMEREIMVYQGDAELMQSTNIFDKNGKEIFESDYLKYSNDFGFQSIHKVFRVQGGLVINSHPDDINKTTPFYNACADNQTKQYMEQCEVIGNAYENAYEG